MAGEVITEQPLARPLRILMLSAEVAPFAKTGGLADVVGSLPKALQRLGHDVRVAMPAYGFIDSSAFPLTPVADGLVVPMDSTTVQGAVYQGELPGGVPVYFIHNAHYFDREGIYMYADDAERFIFFARGALECVKRLNWQPDIIHCHDWHTALVPNWLRTVYANEPFFANTASVYTIHNLAYQGVFGYRVLEVAGLAAQGFLQHPDLPHFSDALVFMARGILFADIITTVSERYAEEIRTAAYGERLDPLLRDRADRLFGVLNGIDEEMLNPSTDPHIYANFDLHTLDRRSANKQGLQREAGLPVAPRTPLIGAISRLTDQKGFDLIGEVLEAVLRAGAQFVLLGTGDPRYHEMFTHFAETYPDRVRVFLTFNAPLAQKIYAGSDLFLMPSRFEPCGLGQMIAMRYGSIPVVRETGGLADTVQNYDPETGTGYGFVFGPYDHHDLLVALARALETYHHHTVWRSLMERCMRLDFSWRASARRYSELYEKALAHHAAEQGAKQEVRTLA